MDVESFEFCICVFLHSTFRKAARGVVCRRLGGIGEGVYICVVQLVLKSDGGSSFVDTECEVLVMMISLSVPGREGKESVDRELLLAKLLRKIATGSFVRLN